MASVGHIIDLDSRSMSVDVDNKYEPTYEILKDKKKVVTDLRQAYKKYPSVLLATDKDREGEMIAWSLAHILNIK